MRLLDLYCGAGGSAAGYHHAGFDDITGVDIAPQPRYPYRFIQADALQYHENHGTEYDFIHASPPCQAYSIMNNLPWMRHRTYPLLILPTLELLRAVGKPYVLENVMGARHGAKGLTKRGLEAHGLEAGYLCGTMFGKPYYRHRLFATDSWLWLTPEHPKHRLNPHPRSEGLPGGMAGMDVRPRRGGTLPHSYADGNRVMSLGEWQERGGVGIGHAKGWRLAAEAMEIDWCNRTELTQAIPPVYTEHIGREMLKVVAS